MKRLILIFIAALALVSCVKKTDGVSGKSGTYKGQWEENDVSIEIENGAAVFSYSQTLNVIGVDIKESVSAWGTLEEKENGVYYASFNTQNVKIKAKLEIIDGDGEEYLQLLEKDLLMMVESDADIALAKAYCAGKEITFDINSDLFGHLLPIPDELEFTLNKADNTFELNS